MSEENKQGNMMRYAGLATQWMVMLALAVWAGVVLDRKTGWKFPLFVVLLPLTALCFSLWKLIKEVSKPKK
ncbi:MAG: hypothetical protein BGO70_10700 [Bacteroidetes bacterium 43-93]|nr:ATPase F0F1 [Bacteroidota bacterium]OJW95584.1 MAG: hypothetical protein BGO70_10700 [Bacteroidetes bacterium 43-93]